MAKLDRRQIVPLTSGEEGQLREAARIREITPGLFARALLAYGMAHLDDPDVVAAVDAEKAAATQRISAGAKAAVASRWGR
ncbi:hypothetical protein LH935_14910 [Gordonia polyisoprenivorans]|uniref:hypothetical protein n=1 Tax=Gordonia polyisoprenivorans TaxID=84595 RepID=UPI0022346818|nr:hypothetical protein LH935_14910 [Gordonia polyisoprenivorans]